MKFTTQVLSTASLIVVLGLGLGTAQAQQPAAEASPAAQPAAAAPTADMAEGEVRRIDKEGGRVTLKHGEIKSLDMPPMTMVFVVKDKAALDGLKAGDKIRFKAAKEAGKYTVTELIVVRRRCGGAVEGAAASTAAASAAPGRCYGPVALSPSAGGLAAGFRCWCAVTPMET